MIPRVVLSILLGYGVVCASAIPITEQQVLGSHLPSGANVDGSEHSPASSRKLSGRFLHITDFHLDKHYASGTSDHQVCHRGEGSAGPLGHEGSDCDSPLSLIDETFRWIEKHLKDQIDFVLWTGDSARHDNDEKIPRTAAEIVDMNEILATKFLDVFKDPNASRGLSIPIIPTIGNNDIMPHNIFKHGPNRWTKRLSKIWGKFIPEHQRHAFEEGGWFAAEVIPHKLAAISLNTMYFYESNSAVDGCAAKSEPGYEHMEWLRVQLELLRERDMKAILIGHVPPARAGNKRNWDETCWQKYTLWLNRFRDVIVGSVYGHMNIDHFMFQDSQRVDILEDGEPSGNEFDDPSGDFTVQSRSSYLSRLRKDWAKMPSPPDEMFSDFFNDDGSETVVLGKKERRFLKKIGGPWAERYSVSLVSPSVIPNYFPTLRVIEYNITGLEDALTWADAPDTDSSFESFDWDAADSSSDELHESKKKDNRKDKKKKKPNFKVPHHPSRTAPPGPAYSNQPLTWLSYAQYYANLTMIYDQTEWPDTLPEKSGTEISDLYNLEYDTSDDQVYKMKDLTVRSFFKLATRIAEKNPRKEDTMSDDGDEPPGTTGKRKKRKRRNRVWRTFLDRAFVGFLTNDELDDIQG